MFNKNKKGLSIQILILTGLMVVASMFYKYASAVYKDYQVESELKNLKNSITQIENSNKDLEKRIDYLDTNAYKEIVAKGELNLRKPGEIVIAIKDPKTTEQQEVHEEFTPDSEYIHIPIYKKWMSIFLDR